MQSMADDPVTACESCGAPVERVFRPVAVHFKGSGFYTTDYARKASSNSGGDSKPESKTESKSESKPDSGAKTETKSKD
jgi:predicted nucleic acid-binding Zn ribbon protein